MVFHNPMLLGQTGAALWSPIPYAMKFNGIDEHLQRVLPGPTMNKGTLFCLVKKPRIAITQAIWWVGNTGNNDDLATLKFQSSNDSLNHEVRGGGSGLVNQDSVERFFDSSAWMSIGYRFDVSLSGNARSTVYANGVPLSYSTTSYSNSPWDPGRRHHWGRRSSASLLHFDGLMALCMLVDDADLNCGLGGDLLDAEGNPRSIEELKALVDAGNSRNSHLLTFENASNLGEDSSIHGNDYTVNGSPERVTDTPSNNLPVFNPIETGISGNVTNGGQTLSGTANQKATHAIYTGRFAWRYTASAAGTVGVVSLDGTETTVAVSASDVIEFELDATTQGAAELWYRLNGGARTVAGLLLAGPFLPLFKAAGTLDFVTAPSDSAYRLVSSANLRDEAPAAGSYTANNNSSGPVVHLGYAPEAVTVEGSQVVFDTDADRLANGFKLRTNRSPINNGTGTKNYTQPTKRRAFANTRTTLPLAEVRGLGAASANARASEVDSMTRTLLVPTDGRKFTIAFWANPKSVGTQRTIAARGVDGNNEARVFFRTTNTIAFVDYRGGSYAARVSSAETFPADEWHHFQIVYDSAAAVASDRVKIYADNVLVTSFEFSTYPAQNHVPLLNQNAPHYIGRAINIGSNHAYDGLLFDLNWVDGLALGPDTFVQNVMGTLLPKDYSGAFGNNGFNLDFLNKLDLGKDVSGNGNDWVNSGFTPSANGPA